MDLRSFINYLQYEKRYSSHTTLAYEQDLLQFDLFLKKTFDLKNIFEANHNHIRSWLVSMMENEISARSINRKLSTLKTFYKFNLKNGHISQNPVARVIAPKMAKKLPVFINSSQMESFWEKYNFGSGYEGMRSRIIFELLYATGMRRSELISLRDHAIDFSNSQLKVKGKGNKERIIPISESLKKQLEDFIAARNEKLQMASPATLLVDESGGPLTPGIIYKVVKDGLSTISSVEKKSPHVLRHTFATHLLNNGAEISAIKELLGHASLAATQVYTHNTIDKLKAVYKKAHPKA